MRFYVITFILINCVLPGMLTQHVSCQQQLSGFIKEGTFVHCDCTDTEATEVSWTSTNQEILDNYLPGTDQATFAKNITRRVDSAVVECVSVRNGTNSSVSFDIQVAYGPDSVTLVTSQKSTVVDACPTCGKYITVNCQPINFSPAVNTNIYLNQTMQSNSQMYNITQFNNGGTLTVTCRSSNGNFTEIVATNSTEFIVRVPPLAAPLLKVNNDPSTTVTLGEAVAEISCLVDGGYPPVDNVTIQCGNLEPISDTGDNVTNRLNVTRTMNGTNCTCWASHVTGYYNQRTSIRLLVIYPPLSAPLITVNNMSGTMVTLTEGVAQISCMVDGGYPQVSNVTIQCGNLQPISGKGNHVNNSLNVTRGWNGAACSCWASHATGKYNQRTSVLFIVMYKPEIISFTINELSSAQNVSSGTSANFYCLADGNPQPTLIIINSNESQTLFTGFSRLFATKVLTCKDTATYICQAKNSVGLASIQSINIYVFCATVPTSPLNTTPIIVGVVVPVVILALVIAVVVVVIHRKRSRPQKREDTEQENTPSHVYTNIGPNGSHLSGCYNTLDRNTGGKEKASHNATSNNSPAPNEDVSKRQRDRFQLSPSTSSLDSIQTVSDVSGMEIIPVTTDADEPYRSEDTVTEKEEHEPPEIPIKIGPTPPRTSDTESNPYDVPGLKDPTTSTGIDPTKPPPIPSKANKKFVFGNTRPSLKKKDS